MKKRILLVVLATVISSCVSTNLSVTREPDASKFKKVSIVYMPRRYAELEPCGCSSVAQKGGVTREWNALQSIKVPADTLQLRLSSGPSFTLLGGPDLPKEAVFVKNDYLVDSLNQMKTDAVSIATRDLEYGLDYLEKLKAKAKFPFISANVIRKSDKKPVFTPSITLNKLIGNVVLTGLTSNVEPLNREAAKVIEIADPVESLKSLLKEMSPRPSLLVVLSALPEDTNKQLLYDSDIPLLILGADEIDSSHDVRQWTGKAISLNHTDRGREVSVIDLQLTASPKTFIDPTVSQTWRDRIASLKEKIKATVQKLKQKGLKPIDISSYETEKKESETFLARAESVPQKENADTVRFQSTYIPLEEKWEKPANPMHELLNRYRKDIKKFALKGDF